MSCLLPDVRYIMNAEPAKLAYQHAALRYRTVWLT